ncbi:MAG: hypothetical protein JST23_01405 [Bacteroidetes bacterium]|nr:hypothetical protein [Bacteroidota bacterium]
MEANRSLGYFAGLNVFQTNYFYFNTKVKLFLKKEEAKICFLKKKSNLPPKWLPTSHKNILNEPKKNL